MKLKQKIGKLLIPRLPVNRRTFDILRFELNAALTNLLNRVSPRLIRVKSHIRKQQHLNVNVGSGGYGKVGWVNIDLRRHYKDLTFPYDIRRRLPFRDGQVARIFAEHVVEHMEFREEIPHLMREFYRVLEPDGRVRIIVPDGGRWLEAYVTRNPEKWKALGMSELPGDMPTEMAMINHVFHQDGEHFFAYDFKTMKYVLEQAGFSEISKMAYARSEDAELCLDREEHAKYSLYVEAQK